MVILYILLALMLALIAVLTFNTVKVSKKARKLTEFKPFYNDDEIKEQCTLRAIELVEDDELIKVELTDDNCTMMLVTHNGMAIRFDGADVRPMGRTAHGVRGIRLSEGDYVVGACVAPEGVQLLVVTENGYGKKTDYSEYRVQSRGGKGIFTYRLTDRTGKLAGIQSVNDDNDIMLITTEGVLIRMHADEISTFGRQTQGVRLMRLKDDVKLYGFAKTERAEDEDVSEENTAEVDENENN